MRHDFVTKPVLVGELATLRPFMEADLPAVVEILNDPDVGRLTGSFATTAELESSPTLLDDELRGFYLRNMTAPDRLDLAIVDNDTRAVVGEAVLNRYDAEDESANFRILIGPRGRDRGLGTESTQLITDHGLDTIGLRRITLNVFSFNPRARRAYEKAGFRLEHVLKGAFTFDGTPVDEEVMVRTR